MRSLYQDIIWFLPIPRNQPAVHVRTQKGITINGELMKQIGMPVQIGYGRKCRELIIQEVQEGGRKLAKSGTLKDSRIPKSIVESGVRLPVRFIMEKTEDGWVGTIEEETAGPKLKGKIPAKAKSINLKSLRKEVENL